MWSSLRSAGPDVQLVELGEELGAAPLLFLNLSGEA